MSGALAHCSSERTAASTELCIAANVSFSSLRALQQQAQPNGIASRHLGAMRSAILAAAVATCAALQHTPPPRRPRVILQTSKKHSGTRQRPKGAGRVRQGGKRGDLLKGIYDAPAVTKEGPSITEDPLLPFVEALARAADQRKGRAIAAFHVAPLTDVASFVIAACGRSRPQCD